MSTTTPSRNNTKIPLSEIYSRCMENANTCRTIAIEARKHGNYDLSEKWDSEADRWMRTAKKCT